METQSCSSKSSRRSRLALVFSIGSAFAAVDVYTASSDALRGIKGIGPAKAKAILDERQAHGPFKDASDLSARVKGLGGMSPGAPGRTARHRTPSAFGWVGLPAVCRPAGLFAYAGGGVRQAPDLSVGFRLSGSIHPPSRGAPAWG